MMKLKDYEPHWFAVPGHRGQGLTFKCPLHLNCHFMIGFRNPLDGGEPYVFKRVDGTDCPLWVRQGEDFETLTLTPSIDAIDDYNTIEQKTHWHGFIINGEIITIQ